jgi:hypothetical protein
MKVRFSSCAFVLSGLSVLVATPLRAQTVIYTPFNNDTPMTGSASAPVTVTITRYDASHMGQPGYPTQPPPGAPFTFAITQTDLDTYVESVSLTKIKKPDITCKITIGSVQYPTGTPTLRGSSPDGSTITWDIAGFGPVVPTGVPVFGAVDYNVYTLSNNRPVGDVLLDTDYTVTQNILVPVSL